MIKESCARGDPMSESLYLRCAPRLVSIGKS